jgi:hypothetical protein
LSCTCEAAWAVACSKSTTPGKLMLNHAILGVGLFVWLHAATMHAQEALEPGAGSRTTYVLGPEDQIGIRILEAFAWTGHFFITTNYIGSPGSPT